MATTVRTRRTLAKTGVLTGLILGALFAGLPVLWMLSTSFKGNGEVFQSPPRLITKGFSFDAYREIFGNGAQLRFFLNSYIVALSVTALTLLVAILAAYAFSRFTFPGQKTINAVIVSVQAVPPITLVIPYFGLVVALGLYNTYPGLILTHMVFTLPYAIIMTTVPIGIQLLMGQHSYEWNQMMAMSILGSIPVLILFLIFQRRFIGGLTAGAVKA